MHRLIAFCVAAALAAGCHTTSSRKPRPYDIVSAIDAVVSPVDGAGRPIRELQAGSTLFVGASGLAPGAPYMVRFTAGEGPAESLQDAIGFAIVTSDSRGAIPPFVLWYESGVIGCNARPKLEPDPRRFRFRTFEEAEEALAGRELVVSVHPVMREDVLGRKRPEAIRTLGAAAVFRLPVTRRASPMIYPSNAGGCLVNAMQVREEGDLYATGRNFPPGAEVEISVVANQRAWRVGDRIADVTGKSERVRAGTDGRFTVRIWDRLDTVRGAFDLVAHDLSVDGHIGRNDIISFGPETALILYLLYPPGGSQMDLAGRPLNRSPYFEFADSFNDVNDPVWAAVDPTYIPAGHTGGTWAAYYVVPHRDVMQWGMATDLVDQSGGFEVHPVKAGCVNGTDVIVWNPPLLMGEYDVVVDFGGAPANDAGSYMTDANYDNMVDFLDGASQIGFIVAKDPYELGTFPIGTDEYSVDDFFPMLGNRVNVDLRAVIRYPATVAGAQQPVAAGQHPIFIIEHGNHSTCVENGFDGDPDYDLEHTGCPTRVQNHKGYMGLLDRLASHGIIAVSIDAYDLTGFVPQLNPERSDLILKHLELWSHMHDHATFATYPDLLGNRFVGHVDMNKISVSGHSRGGEASVGAYMRNMGVFNIGSVSSIAPVDSGVHNLPDVPYFVIIPAADGDVSNLSGQRIYDRAGGLSNTTTKSLINVYGASHNYFNTVWAADGDDGYPMRDDKLSDTDQQRLGEAWLAGFTRSNLNGETVYEDMLRGKLRFPSFAGAKIYPARHEKPFQVHENGGNGGTPGGTATSAASSPPLHQTGAIKVGWTSTTGTLTYTVPMGQRDLTGFEVLSFRVAQTTSNDNPAGPQEFRVELVGGGKSKATYTGNFGTIPDTYEHWIFDWFNQVWEPFDETLMTTVRIPLHSFIMNNSGVTLDDIDTVRFAFLAVSKGEVHVDDIEFSR